MPEKADKSLEGAKDEGLLKSPEPQNGIRAKFGYTNFDPRNGHSRIDRVGVIPKRIWMFWTFRKKGPG